MVVDGIEIETDEERHLHYTYSKRAGDVMRKFWRVHNQGMPEDYERLAALLGDPYRKNRRYILDVSKQRIRDLVDALDGPHGYALLKALEIQHRETDK